MAYLNARDIAINVLFFKVFEHAGQKLLSRAWMIDPGETQANAAPTTPSKGEGKAPWNGEFYVSYGSDRSWDDARQYGFISGGGGTGYSQTLKLLTPGTRPALEVLQDAKAYAQTADDPEQAEYFVHVKWLDTVDAAHAFNEVGLFGNQNTVCQPRAAKWRHSVERLKTVLTGWGA